MYIKLFVKQDCPRCPAAKRVVQDFAGVQVYDVDDVDGLTEASFHGVLSTPSILVMDSTGKEIGGWRGEVPAESELRELVAQ